MPVELLARINEWCSANGVYPFTAAHLVRPDNTGPQIVDFLPEESVANRGFAGTMMFMQQGGRNRYRRSWRVNCWKEGIQPVLIDAVLVVVVARVKGEFHLLFSENYRHPVGCNDLDPARGFATDIDHAGESSLYPLVTLPSKLWKANIPEDQVLGLNAARKEFEEEICGDPKQHRQFWYMGFMQEANSFARMHSGIWLATVEAEHLNDIKPGRPDSLQGKSVSIPLRTLMEGPATRFIRGAQVVAVVSEACSLLRLTEARFGSFDPLWTAHVV